MDKLYTKNMPGMDTADLVLKEMLPNSAERFRFWLISHSSPKGEWMWRRLVMEVCLASPDCDLDKLEAVGELLR